MRIVFAALLIVFILGAWFRIEGVISKSFAFTYDVGRDLLAVGDIVHLGKIPLIGPTTGLPGLFYGPWWYFILTPVFILASGNPVGIAFFMSISGMVTVLLGFKIGKSIGGVVLSIVFASLLSLSPVMVAVASQIWSPNLIPLFIVFFMYCLHFIFVSLERKKSVRGVYLFFLGLLLGLILDSEIVFGLLFSIGVIVSIIIALGKRLKLKDYSFFILGFFVIISPRIIFDLRHNFLMTNSLLSFIVNTFSFAHGSQRSFVPVNSFMALYNLWKDTASAGNVFLGFVLLLLVTFGLVLFYKKMKKEEKFFLKTHLIILLTFLIGLSFFPGDIWGHYIVGIPVLYIFILSIAVSKALQNLKKIRFFIAFALIIYLMLHVNPIQTISRYQKPLWEGDASLYRNQLAVVDNIYKQANGKDFNYVLYTPPVYDYSYKYIFSWYGKERYGYLPKKEKASLFFLIMEPDYQYPFRLTNWLEVRKNDGKIIKEEIGKGGIRIQTRIH